MGIIAASMLAFAHPSAAEKPSSARVVGDRVNLRAKPELTSEVIGQVMDGDSLAVLDVQDEWIRVVPPDSLEFWVHRDFVDGDKVTTRKLNVRAGAGINYNVVGMLSRGDSIERRGTFGEWIKIAPVDQSSVWVSKSLVELTYPSQPLPPPPVAEPIPAPAPSTAGEPAERTPVFTPPPPEPVVEEGARIAVDPLEGLELIPLAGQGRTVQREGRIKRSPWLFFDKPAPYRLVRRHGNKIETICFLKGNSTQLEALEGETLVVHGKEYWVEGVKQPLILIETIEKKVLF